MKKSNYYLQSLPITIGTLLVARIVYCFFGAFKYANSIFTDAFWGYFAASFKFFSPVFWLFGIFFLIATLGLLFQVRNAHE